MSGANSKPSRNLALELVRVTEVGISDGGAIHGTG